MPYEQEVIISPQFREAVQSQRLAGVRQTLIEAGASPAVSNAFIEQLLRYLDVFPDERRDQLEEEMESLVAAVAQNQLFDKLEPEQLHKVGTRIRRGDTAFVGHLAWLLQRYPDPKEAREHQLAYIRDQQRKAGHTIIKFLQDNNWFGQPEWSVEDFGILSSMREISATFFVLRTGETGFGIPALVYSGQSSWRFDPQTGEAERHLSLFAERLLLLPHQAAQDKFCQKILLPTHILKSSATVPCFSASERAQYLGSDAIEPPLTLMSDQSVENPGIGLRGSQDILDFLQPFILAQSGEVTQQLVLDMVASTEIEQL